MKASILEAKLRSLDEERLRDVYEDLVRISTGGEADRSPDLLRTINLIETTDYARGSLLRNLLGEVSGLDDFPTPADEADRLHLDTTFTFESDPSASEPIFHLEVPGGSRQRLDPNSVRQWISQATEAYPVHIHVTAAFQGLPPGWSLVIHPPVPPGHAVFSAASAWDPSTFWLLCCADEQSAHRILHPFEQSPRTPLPLLVSLGDRGQCDSDSDRPLFCRHLPFHEDPETVVDLVRQFLQTARNLSKPGKLQMIASVLMLHESALQIHQRAAESRSHSEECERLIAKADLDWKELFANERRAALNDLRLETVAHLMTKLKLLTRNSREAQVAVYVRRQLYPRIRILVQRAILDIEGGLRRNHSTRIGTNEPGGRSDIEPPGRVLTSGVLHALPSLALMLPVSFVNGSELTGAVKRVIANQTATGSPSTTELDAPAAWIDSIRERIFSPVSDRLDQVLENQDELEEIVTDGFLNLTQVVIGATAGAALGTAAAGLLTSYVVIQGSISLRQTEEMIEELLQRTEKTWPRVASALRSVAASLRGEIDEPTLGRSQKIIQYLEEI